MMSVRTPNAHVIFEDLRDMCNVLCTRDLLIFYITNKHDRREHFNISIRWTELKSSKRLHLFKNKKLGLGCFGGTPTKTV